MIRIAMRKIHVLCGTELPWDIATLIEYWDDVLVQIEGFPKFTLYLG
jgi:hypothetical protein